MNDVQSQVSQAEQAVKGAATAFEQKQVGWVRRNAVALVIGFALGLIAGLIL